MNLHIEVEDNRRVITQSALKIYGTAEELTKIRDAIQDALDNGLVLGWVGVGAVDKETVFPNNGKQDVPTTVWHEKVV